MTRRFAMSAAGLIGVIAGASAQAPTGQGPGSPPTFHAATRLVQFNVVVRSKDGQPVRGLTAGDFKLFDKGKAQPIEAFSVQSNARAIGLARSECGHASARASASDRAAQRSRAGPGTAKMPGEPIANISTRGRE